LSRGQIRRRTFRRRFCRLRRRDAGDAEQHERRTAQQKQTPPTDRHHTPHILDGNDPSAPTINALRRKQRPMGNRPGPRERESGPRPDRCQAMGGARARNGAPCDAVRSNSAGRFEPQPAENGRHRQRRYLGRPADGHLLFFEPPPHNRPIKRPAVRRADARR